MKAMGVDFRPRERNPIKAIPEAANIIKWL